MAINQPVQFINPTTVRAFNDFDNLVKDQNIDSIVNILQIPKITDALSDCKRIANTINENLFAIKNKVPLIQNGIITINTRFLFPLSLLANHVDKMKRLVAGKPNSEIALITQSQPYETLDALKEKEFKNIASQLKGVEETLVKLDKTIKEILSPSPLPQELGSDV